MSELTFAERCAAWGVSPDDLETSLEVIEERAESLSRRANLAWDLYSQILERKLDEQEAEWKATRKASPPTT